MSEMSPIFFVHVPKTAGTSLREAAVAALGAAHCEFDYGAQAPETTALVREHAIGAQDRYALRQAMDAAGRRWLGGHVNLMRYAPLFEATRIISFVREPLQQVAAHHAHSRRLLGYDDDLLTFAARPQGCGMQAAMLGGPPIEALGVIGVTERHAESVQLMAEALDLPLASLARNQNPERAEGRPYTFSETEQQALQAASTADQRLYERAQHLLDRRLAARAAGVPFVNGAITGLRPNRVLEGFAFEAGQARPVSVRVLIDGALHATQLATAFAHRLSALRLPRGGFVGFEVALPKGVTLATHRIEVLAGEHGQPLPLI